jgi:hypothetical protein
MDFHKVNNRTFVCFSQQELGAIYKAGKINDLKKEMAARKVSLGDIANDRSKMKEIADAVGDRGAADRDEHEIFASRFIFTYFYGKDSEVCFEMRDEFNPTRDKIASLEDLIGFRKVATDSDFMIRAKDGFRNFQMKRYRGELDTQSLFEFIVNKVAHYANNLGDTNLLVQIQGPDYARMDVNFHELHDKIKSEGFRFLGQILISYNDNNKSQVIIQVHPELTETKIPFLLPSERESL